MTKPMNTTDVTNELQTGSVFFPSPKQEFLSKPKETQTHAQITAQKDEQLSKPLSEEVSRQEHNPGNEGNNIHTLQSFIVFPTAEAIELMSFQLRKTKKSKINAEIAEEWKAALDEMAFKLHIGKYELVEYIIGRFLGKIGE